jgi:Kef-type K+ transport system membrane component KefB
VIGFVYELGLLMLMFTAGTQVRALIDRSAVRTVGAIAVSGLVIPFAAGLAVFSLSDPVRFEGAAHDGTALLLVMAIAVAVTSIPVISRIMLDLGILETRFARIVLAVAVVEDVVLYIVLAVAVGIAAGHSSPQFGLADALGWAPGSLANDAYHTGATLAFLAVGLGAGPAVYARLLRSRYNLVRRRSPVAFQLTVMLAMSCACLLLSIVPMFGAFVAGIVVATSPGEHAAIARSEMGRFALGVFIPVYFAVVGLGLDLVGHLDLAFFAAFTLFACAVKAASVWGAARAAGETPGSAVNLAVALNARGGPGIVLASTAATAGIIDRSLYTTLVLLSVVTSLVAGYWLQRVHAADPQRAVMPAGDVPMSDA